MLLRYLIWLPLTETSEGFYSTYYTDGAGRYGQSHISQYISHYRYGDNIVGMNIGVLQNINTIKFLTNYYQ